MDEMNGEIIKEIKLRAVADPGFPRRNGVPTSEFGAKTNHLARFLPKRDGGGASLANPWNCQCLQQVSNKVN